MNTELMFSSKTDLHATPPAFFEKWDKLYRFETDVCALPENAKCAHFFTPTIDGLKQDWKGVCWMNPPYGRAIKKWIAKAYDEANKHNSIIVALLPARTDTDWFHSYIYNQQKTEFIKGRLKFGGAKYTAPFPNMIVVFKRIDLL